MQEKFEHYGTFEDSNKLSMEAFQELFADQVTAHDHAQSFSTSCHLCCNASAQDCLIAHPDSSEDVVHSCDGEVPQTQFVKFCIVTSGS